MKNLAERPLNITSILKSGNLQLNKSVKKDVPIKVTRKRININTSEQKQPQGKKNYLHIKSQLNFEN